MKIIKLVITIIFLLGVYFGFTQEDINNKKNKGCENVRYKDLLKFESHNPKWDNTVLQLYMGFMKLKKDKPDITMIIEWPSEGFKKMVLDNYK